MYKFAKRLQATSWFHQDPIIRKSIGLTYTPVLFSHLSLSQTIPVWPLLPVLLPAIRSEEPRGDALKRQTLQMWILWPCVRWGYHTQQPHTHAHRGEAVQVSNREYPPTHPTHSLLLPAPCRRLRLAWPVSLTYGTQLSPFTYLLTPFLLPNNLPITCWHRSYKGCHFF